MSLSTNYQGWISGLISKAVVGEWEDFWRKTIKSIPDTELASGPELSHIIELAWKDKKSPWQRLLDRNFPELTFAVLCIARSNDTNGNERNEEYPAVLRLSWDLLIMLYSNEEVLKAHIGGILGPWMRGSTN